MKFHTKARIQNYPRTENTIERLMVIDDKVEWTEKWDDYKPPSYTSESVFNMPWADPDVGELKFKPKWNQLDGNVNRVSHTGIYEIVNSYPRNPLGRTGLAGRGCLSRWGPNHRVDPIITRWKRDLSNTLTTDRKTNLPILQFIAVLRSDTREWAIPGGVIDPGEKVTAALQQEFSDETISLLKMTPDEKANIKTNVDKFFNGGTEMYKGYVDDPRNTDNAWVETISVNFHDGTGDAVAKFPLCRGNESIGVHWTDLSSNLSLYPIHIDFLEAVSKLRKAHW